VYTEVDCSPVDFYNRSDQIAMQSLLDVEDYQVEKAFWTGTAAVGNAVLPHLAANAAQTDAFSQSTITLQIAATTVTGTAVNIVDGLGMLEQALGQCFVGAGIIHVPPNALPVLDALGLVYSDGSRLRTRRGNLVAVGSGYPTTSPAGVAAPFGQSWIYATGPMFMYRSAPKLVAAPKESFVRSTNLVKAIAERTYVLGFDCCLYAVLVYTKSIIATSTAG
jgi:hypothetical protein